MQEYLIVAHDGTDAEAADRRLKTRPAHFEKARELKAKGNFVTGGAILNDSGEMTGSMMVVRFSTEEELRYWMDTEPYIANGVWKDITVRPFKTAEV